MVAGVVSVIVTVPEKLTSKPPAESYIYTLVKAPVGSVLGGLVTPLTDIT
jgi:hypothetical protein